MSSVSATLLDALQGTLAVSTPPPTPAASSEVLRPGVPPHAPGLPTILIQDHEHVGLLDDDGDEDGADKERTTRAQVDIMSRAAPHAVPSKAAHVLGIERSKDSTPGKTLGRGLGRTWEAAKTWVNPALVGGLIAPMPSSAGALQMFTLGATLVLTPSSLTAKPTVYVCMPAIYMGAVWSTAGHGWYDPDGLMWFLLILVPSGPSALLLLSVAQQEHVTRARSRDS
ncbi:hypothetical protein FIBSPDRAFT_945616 [Athelia psychrophila]|uniref:Uncharacterized protein n=1 Tax=Athelia psychrophila TaxID=1759441 RepID=A0A166TJH0_9AGAM|nr:hypothetical protein FIBSPDRAFT_945616 [Fibularhizoctonia sp. CBS 109695]